MGYILASVLFSVLVSVLLKLAPRSQIDLPQAVAWNYLCAAAVLALLWRPSLHILLQPHAPLLPLLGLGVLLPVIFIVLSYSVRHAGIVRSDVAQRLSLLLSLPAAFVFFGEKLTFYKGIGIALALAALLCLVWRRPQTLRHDTRAWAYPLLVCAGFAVIDVLLKQIAQSGLPFAALLLAAFICAFVIAQAIQLWRRWCNGIRMQARSMVGGLLLGLGNAGNIVCYIRGHQVLPNDPALVFASTNLGVIVLGTLVGRGLFRERWNRINSAGLLLAVSAIGIWALRACS